MKKNDYSFTFPMHVVMVVLFAAFAFISCMVPVIGPGLQGFSAGFICLRVSKEFEDSKSPSTTFKPFYPILISLLTGIVIFSAFLLYSGFYLNLVLILAALNSASASIVFVVAYRMAKKNQSKKTKIEFLSPTPEEIPRY